MGPISYSQAKLFSDCPAKFKAERIDGMRPESSLPMKQGSFVHLVTEVYSKRLLETGEASRPELAKAIGEELWAKGGHGLPDLVKDDCLRVAERVARHIILVKKDVVGVELEVALDHRGRLVPWDSPQAAVRGKLDRLEASTDDQGSYMLVWDLKAGRSIDNPDESVQLALYGALARVIMPTAGRFEGRLYFPRHETERVTELSKSRMDSALKWALDVRAAIVAAKKSGVWNETPGRACSDCPRFWVCDKRKEMAAYQVRIPQTEDDAAEMVLRLEVLGREMSELREMLALFIDRHGEITVGGLVADILPKVTWKFPTKQLLKLLERFRMDPAKYLKSDNRRLKLAVAKTPGLGPALEAIGENETRTQLDIRRFGQESKNIGEENENQ